MIVFVARAPNRSNSGIAINVTPTGAYNNNNVNNANGCATGFIASKEYQVLLGNQCINAGNHYPVLTNRRNTSK